MKLKIIRNIQVKFPIITFAFVFEKIKKSQIDYTAL
jgi:hypothetical protein